MNKDEAIEAAIKAYAARKRQEKQEQCAGKKPIRSPPTAAQREKDKAYRHKYYLEHKQEALKKQREYRRKKREAAKLEQYNKGDVS